MSLQTLATVHSNGLLVFSLLMRGILFFIWPHSTNNLSKSFVIGTCWAGFCVSFSLESKQQYLFCAEVEKGSIRENHGIRVIQTKVFVFYFNFCVNKETCYSTTNSGNNMLVDFHCHNLSTDQFCLSWSMSRVAFTIVICILWSLSDYYLPMGARWTVAGFCVPPHFD